MSRLFNALFRAGLLPLALLLAVAGRGADRVIRAQDMTVARGETNRLFISFDSAGDENALGFTICFDTNYLTFIRAVRGSAVSNEFPFASFSTNIVKAASQGHVGILLGLDVASLETWPAGTHGIVEILFRGVNGFGSITTPVWFCDSPVAREVSDPEPNPLPTTFVDANVFVQGPCLYSLDTNAASFGADGSSGSVSITADSACAWTVDNSNTWITITSSTNGNGNGVVNFSVAGNSDFNSRSGTLVVAGQTFTVNQGGFVCVYSVSPTNRSHGFGASTNSVDLITDNQCAWSVQNTNDWIAILSVTNGSGSALIDYAITDNANLFPRTGLVMIADQVLTLVQDAFVCTYSLSRTNVEHGYAGGTNSLDVIAAPLCVWAASTTNDWITFVSQTNGAGTGTVSYAVAPNVEGTLRNGAISVADQVFVITQSGLPCIASLSATNRSHGFNSETGLVNVTIPNGCAWTVENTNFWIAIETETGNGTVVYTVASNTAFMARSGVMTIAGENFTITQAAVPCPATLSTTNIIYSSSGATGLVSVAITEGCAWSVDNTNSWIAILSGGSDTGTNIVSYTVAENTNVTARIAVLTIAGEVLTIVQSGAPCIYELSPANRDHDFAAVTNSFDVNTVAGCDWDVVNTNDWIIILSGGSGSGHGTVTYSNIANPSALSRAGALFVGGQTFLIMQAGAPCAFSISPSDRTHGFDAATNTIELTTLTGCEWTISNLNAWITFPAGTNGSGSLTNIYFLAANPDPEFRTGTVMLADQVFTIVQGPAPCSYALTSSNASHGFAFETGFVSVTAADVCSWSATTTNDWITLAATNGAGNGTLSYTVGTNPDSASRTGAVEIADQVFIITQNGAPCSFAVLPSSANHGFNSETGLVAVAGIGGCTWTTINTNDWITITSGETGLTSGTLGYSIAANTSTNARTGIMAIGGQDFTITQTGVPPPCFYFLSLPDVAQDFGAITGAVDLVTTTNCTWNASTTNGWITIITPTNGIGAAQLSYALAANPTSLERTGQLMVADQVLTIIQHGSPCTFVIAPSTRIHGFAEITNSVDVTTPIGCAWSVLNTNDWITLLSPSNNVDSGSVTYALAANATIYARTGTVIIADQILTLVQLGAPCVYAVFPANRTHDYNTAMDLLSVTTQDGCSWLISNTNDWITILAEANNTNSGIVLYTMAANPSILERTGLVFVADQVVTLVQHGAPCAFDVSPTNRALGYAAATGAVSVASLDGCVWSVANNNDWIAILSATNNTGSNSVIYSVAANPTILDRTGSVLVADQVVTFVQSGAPCSYEISPTSQTNDFVGATNFVTLMTLDGCAWQVLNTNDWITITETNGAGATNISYAVAANPFAQWRTGTVVIADQMFTVIQQPAPCIFTFVPTNAVHAAAAENGSFSIGTGADCPWVVTTAESWITITSETNGIGIGEVTYTLVPNPTVATRLGQILVGGVAFSVTQQGMPCTFTVSPLEQLFAAPNATGVVNVTTLDGCAWTVATTNEWITLLSVVSGQSSVVFSNGQLTTDNGQWSGSGVVNYTVAGNNSSFERVGFLSIADQVLIVTQQAASCVYTIDPTNRLHGGGVETGLVSIATSGDCPWQVLNTNSWITISSAMNGVGEGTVGYTIEANPSSILREGVLLIQGQSFRVTQAGAPCTFAITPDHQPHGAGSETGSVAVTTLNGCTWSVVNTNPWITILSGASGSNSASATYSVLPNPTAISRTGIVSIAGFDFIITQSGSPCTFSLSSNNATHGSGSETGSVAVTTLTGCNWSVENTNPWIAILSGTNNTDSGLVTYSVLANPAAHSRTGLVSAAGENFTVTQTGATCTFSIAPGSATHGAGSETGSVAVTTLTGCNWLVDNTNSWIAILSETNATGSGSINYSLLANPTALLRTGTINIAGESFTITQAGAACAFSLATNGAAHGFNSETGSVAVTTLIGCAWSVVNTNLWIGILSDTNATNSGDVFYNMFANPTAFSRTGTVSIAGENFTVTQAGAPCTFSIAPGSATHGAGSETGSVAVTTLTGCNWSVANTNPWIAILSDSDSTNSGPVVYSISPNPTALSRTGIVNIAGENFTVTQAGAGCEFSLASDHAAHGAGVETGTVVVTTLFGCAWSAMSTAPWITIVSDTNNTGSGSVFYDVLANPTALSRTGIVSVAGQDFTVTQVGAPCTFSLATNGAAHGSGSETGSVAVTTLTGCTWTVANTNPWISIFSETNVIDSGTLLYSVLDNPTSIARTGIVSVAGEDFTITQAGAACTFALAYNEADHGAGMETNSVAVTTLVGCAWSIVNTNPWIAILSETNNTNSGDAIYCVLANPSAIERTGIVSIAGQDFVVSQAGAGCTFSISPSNRSHSAVSEMGTVTLDTLEGCEWQVVNANSWIAITSGFSGRNSSTVTYLVTDNSSAIGRTGIVSIAGEVFTVSQAGAPCTFSIAPSSVSHGAGSETGSVAVTTLTGCPWNVENTNPWIAITSGAGTNSGSVNYSVLANPSSIARTGVISIAAQDFTITQAGAACTFTLATNSATHGSEATNGSVSVTTLTGCTWDAQSTNSWIAINTGTSTNSGSVNYSVLANPSSIARTGIVSIAGQSFTIVQSGAPCLFTLGTTNASFGSGATNSSVLLTTLTGCTWTATSLSSWITITAGATGTNSGSISFSVLANPTGATRTGTVNVAGQILIVVQAGLPCTLALQSSNWVHRALAESGAIGVISLAGCPWTVSNTNSWVTITSATSGDGSGHVFYNVAANNNFDSRAGFVNIGGIAFALTQVGTGCTYHVSPTNRVHGSGANANTFSVTAGTGCSWTVLNTNDWITITANASGVGNQTVSYSFTKNNDANVRAGVINVGGDILNIAQYGSACGTVLSPKIGSHGSGAETGAVSVNNSGCSWGTTNTNSWITITSGSGSGNGSIAYTVAANTNGMARSAVFSVNGALFTVNQAGLPCSFALSASNATHSANSETTLIVVTTGAGCVWNVVNTNSWLTITTPPNNTNNGNVIYTVDANPTILTRNGNIIIAGQNFAVSQAGASCTYSIMPALNAHGFGSETGLVSVTTLAGCNWSAVSTNSWITFTSPTNVVSSGSIGYSVAANTNVFGRTGLVLIANQIFEVDQAGAPCSYVISPNSTSHGAGAEVGSFNVAADNLCSWIATNTNSWITINAGNSGFGSRTVSYSVTANPTFNARSGIIVVAGQVFTVTQAAKPCTYVLSPGNASLGAAPDSGSISVTASNECSWNVVNSNSWITITSATNGFGNGTVTYSVATNAGTLRVGNIWIVRAGDDAVQVPFRVAQAGSVRVLRAMDMNVPRGQTNRLLIVLEATGIENALGFSLCFDTNHLSYVQAVKGVDSTNLNATLNVNANAAFLAQGKIGLTIGLNSGFNFSPGSNVIAEVLFRSTPGTTFTNTTIGLCDSPVFREISDAEANSLTANYVPALVNILGTCTYALNTNAASFSASGGTGNVIVSAQLGCAWNVANSNEWISIETGTFTGNGTVNFTVEANPTGLPRTSILTIAGQTFTVNQAGVPCTFALSPNNVFHSAAAETGSVSVISISGCSWMVSNANPWVTITSPTNNSGSSDVAYSLASNTSSVARSGVITIADQTFTINQAGTPCSFVLSPTNKVHGFLSETGLFTVASPSGCVWTVSNTNTWVLITSSTNGSGNGSVTYTVTYNPDGSSRTAIVTIAGQPFTLSQSANTCPVTLSPASRSHSSGAETNSFAVTASSCAWTVLNTNSWITITSPTNGSGNGSVNYMITSNPTLTNRFAVVRVSGRDFTITQAGASCLYGITPSGQSHGSGVETGAVVLATTLSTCDWTTQNTNAWVTITSASSGAGSTTIKYTVTNNPSGIARTGVVVIAGQPFTLTQAGAPCLFTLSPPNGLHDFTLQTGTVAVTTLTGCRWGVSTINPWITILSSTNLTNSGSVMYAVASNATSLTRIGAVLIGDQSFAVSQTGVSCTFSISPTNRTHSSALTTNTVTVMSPIGCNWSVNNTNGWITILTNTSGSGTGIVTYAVDPNPASFARTGTLIIAGQNFIVTQAAASCVYTLSPTGSVNSAAGLTIQQFDLATAIGCVWTLSTSNSWIVAGDFNGETNGSGSATVYYLLDPNPTGASRTGSVRVADQIFTIRQLGQPCSFTLSATNDTRGPAAGSNSVNVTTLSGCAWAVSNSNSWITIVSSTNNVGNGTLNYTVSSNTLAIARTGTVIVAGQPFTVAQSGITCSYSLSPSNGVIGSGNLTGLVSVASSGGCTWAVVNTNVWIAIKSGGEGTNGGLVRYTVAANPSPNPRSGNLVVAGIPFNVTQLGSPCSYTLSSTGRLHGSLFETGQVTVLPSSSDCGWTVNNTNDWIAILSAPSGSGTALISYSVQANAGLPDRTGVFTIADQTFFITQLGAACTYSLLTNNAFHGGLSETGSISIAMPAGCSYAVTETNTWISIISQTTTGQTNGLVKYSIAVNVTGGNRTGYIVVSGQPFAVTQAPVSCVYAVAPTSRSHGFESETNSISVTTSNICPWTVLETNSWITIPNGTNYTGSSTVTYVVAANPSSAPRTGVMLVAGQPVTITQAGLVCTYSLAPTSLAHGFLASTGQVTLTSPTLCSWAVNNTNSWITMLTPLNNVGPGTVRYAVTGNASASPRAGFLTIAGQPFAVSQNGMPFICASNKTLDCSVPWTFDSPVLSGNCNLSGSTVSVVSTTTNKGCGATYVTTRIWDATDACNNHIQCTQTVSVVTLPPLMICAPNKSVDCGSVWTFDAPTAIEYCGGTNVTIRVVSTTTSTNGMCGNTFAVTRTWEATDSCGNKSSCSQTVSVIDATPPVVTPSSNKTVECGSIWNFDTPSALDGCSGTNITVHILGTVTNVSGSCGYLATRTWEFLDPCSNRSTSAQTVTVVDTTPPILARPSDKTVECGSAWNFDVPTATDNCVTIPAITVTTTVTNATGSCGSAFTATRTWQALDGCGNLSSCSQTVRVIDTTPPVVNCASNKTVEIGSTWAFDAPTGFDTCGGTNVSVQIISTETNKIGFCGNTFSATRVWEVADGCSNKVTCSQTVTVRDTTPPVISCAPDKSINCLGVWSFDPPTVVDVGDGTNVLVVIVGTTTNGTCGSGFTATRTWRATDSCGNSQTCSQTALGRALVSVSGTVYNPTNYPATMSDKRVAGATLMGPTNTTGLSALDGTFNCIFDAASNVVITPSPPLGDPAEGITTLDISLVRRHILNVTSLDSPYKLLAADVDGSGTISALDISFMRRLVLGVTNRFPAGLWRFVPSDFTFADRQSPWGAPTNRTYGGVASDISEQDFVAIKLGDVNASWPNGGVQSPRSKVQNSETYDPESLSSGVSFRVSSVTNVRGASVLVPVIVSGFTRVTSAQGTLTWDPAVIRFTGTEGYGVAGLTAGNFGTALAAGSNSTWAKLTFSWDDPNSEGITLPDGTVMFSLRFDVVSEMETISRVALTDSAAVREAAVDFKPVAFRSVDGQVSVEDSSSRRLSQAAFTSGNFGVTLPTSSGKSYILEFTDVLPAKTWTALPPVIGDGTAKTLSDPHPAARQRFYRVRIE